MSVEGAKYYYEMLWNFYRDLGIDRDKDDFVERHSLELPPITENEEKVVEYKRFMYDFFEKYSIPKRSRYYGTFADKVEKDPLTGRWEVVEEALLKKLDFGEDNALRDRIYREHWEVVQDFLSIPLMLARFFHYLVRSKDTRFQNEILERMDFFSISTKLLSEALYYFDPHSKVWYQCPVCGKRLKEGQRCPQHGELAVPTTATFKTYAIGYIRWRVLKMLRMRWTEMTLSLEGLFERDGNSSEEEFMYVESGLEHDSLTTSMDENGYTGRLLEKIMKVANDREKRILRELINTNLDFRETARSLGISESSVRYVLKKIRSRFVL